jgi:hypothetical protein
VNLEPPSGSRIYVTSVGAEALILIPQGDGGVMRYFVGLFVLAWLGGWVVGFSSAVSQLSSGKAPAFLYFWLAAWTLGGVMAMYWLFRMFRPSVPESLKLLPHGVSYDSGIPHLPMSYGHTSHRDAWKSMFPTRTRLELDRRNLQSLRLRETGESNRLTVDANAARLEIARAASEIEREWLYQVLVKRYALPPPQGTPR